MKRLLIYIIMLMGYSTFAQDSVHSIDFTSMLPKYTIVVPSKSSVQIKLTNINRKVFKVDDEKTEEDFNVTLPDALKGIKLPPFIFNSPSPVPKTSGANAQSVSPTEIEKWKNIDKKIQEEIAIIQGSARRLNDAVLFYNDISHLSKDCSGLTKSITDNIKTKALLFLYGVETDPNPAKPISEKLKDTLSIQRKNAESSLKRLKDAIDSYSRGMKAIIDEKILGIEKALKELKDSLKNERNPAKIAELKAEIETRTKSLEEITEEAAKIEKAVEKIDEDYKAANEIVESLLEFEKDDKLYPIYTGFKIFSNPKNYEYYSTILHPDKDETKFTLTITPLELNECTTADKKTTEIKIRTKGGLKIDVSSGAFLNFGNNDFLGNTYYYKRVSSTTREITTAERKNNMMLSVGAMLHFYRRSPAMFKVAGSLGVSTTASFDELNFHAGPSLIIGDKNRFILTTGVTLKSSKALAQQLETGVIYDNDNSPDEIPTVTVFPKAGWFIGLTYNIAILK